MGRHKYRIRFGKTDDLRFLSHHDLMRLFERIMRRAAIPISYTEGFHPKPRMIFAGALALGIVGRDEIVDIEITEPLPADSLQLHLKEAAPPALAIHAVESLPDRSKSALQSASYLVRIPEILSNGLPERIDHILQSDECWINRSKPKPKRINLRKFLNSITFQKPVLEFELAVTPEGSARPVEVLESLGLPPRAAQELIIERIHLNIHVKAAGIPGGPTKGIS